METASLEGFTFTEEEAAMIVSTRIRFCRNCDGYPLGMGVTKE